MSALAAVILAHADPPKVRRLIAALGGCDIFLHCDRKTPETVLRQMLGQGSSVTLVPRRRTSLYSWSLVEAELAGLRLALERSRAEHVAVLSGGCYPLLSTAELTDELAAWRGLSRLMHHPLPYEPWDSPRNPDGGYWRFRRRYLTYRGQIVALRGVPLRTLRRPIPRGLQLHASSQWKIYARSHALALLRVLSDQPEQLRFWQTTLVPDESCAASILRSPDLVGAIADEIRDDCPWYLKWPDVRLPEHPLWLTESDYPALRAARARPPRDPQHNGSDSADATRKLFARKIASREGALLDRIDLELRS